MVTVCNYRCRQQRSHFFYFELVADRPTPSFTICNIIGFSMHASWEQNSFASRLEVGVVSQTC